MAKVTSKRQVTIPKQIALRYGIKPGDEIDWLEAGDSIRVLPPGVVEPPCDPRRRLELFDAATMRQLARQGPMTDSPAPPEREWRREDLYRRGRAR